MNPPKIDPIHDVNRLSEQFGKNQFNGFEDPLNDSSDDESVALSKQGRQQTEVFTDSDEDEL